MLVAAETEFGRRKEPVDNVIVLARSIIDELGAAFRANDEQGRHLALGYAPREFDIDFGAIVKNLGRAPGCIIALDGVTKPQAGDIDAALDRRCRLSLRVLPAQAR